MRFISIIISLQLGDLNGAAVDVMRPDDGLSLGPTTLDQPKPLLPAFRRGPLFKLIQGWKSGAIPIPVFNHKTHKEVVEFLNYYGKSGHGQFGLDRVHEPIMESGDEELIPSGIITDRTVEGSSEIGIITSPFIWKEGKTGVYAIEGIPQKVIKYHAYCWDPETDPYDSIVVESYFMNRLAREAPGITLNVDFYSGYVDDLGSLPHDQRKLLDVQCPKQETEGVEIYVLPHIRYMIMDKVGPSLKQYMMTRPDGRIEFLEAMRLGKEMIQLLKRLHHLNIIHGDAHMGNFAFKSDDVPNSGLILIDFGRAEFVDDETAAKDPTLPHCQLFHPNVAIWEIFGCKVSFRSDVYRAVKMTAMSLYGRSATLYLLGLITPPKQGDRENLREFIRIKKMADFWQLGTSLNLERVLPSTPKGIRDQIRGRLKTVSDWITNCTSKGFYTKPNYDGIIAEYDAIIGILLQPEILEALTVV